MHLDGFVAGTAKTLSEEAARARMAAAQLEVVEQRSATEDGTPRHPRLLEQYGYRARAAARFSEHTTELLGHRTEHFSVVLAVTVAGRTELLRLHRAGEIHDRVLHVLEQELDLDEMRARRFLDHLSRSPFEFET